MTKPPSDREILASLAAGEPAGYAALYARLCRPLFRVAMAMLADRQARKTPCMICSVNLARNRHMLARIADLDAYAFACLRNGVKATIVRRQREKHHLLRLATEREEEAHSPSAEDDELNAALAALPVEQREIVTLKIDGGLTFLQIGQVLGISMNPAASRYRYALEKLRRWLEEER